MKCLHTFSILHCLWEQHNFFFDFVYNVLHITQAQIGLSVWFILARTENPNTSYFSKYFIKSQQKLQLGWLSSKLLWLQRNIMNFISKILNRNGQIWINTFGTSLYLCSHTFRPMEWQQFFLKYSKNKITF